MNFRIKKRNILTRVRRVRGLINLQRLAKNMLTKQPALHRHMHPRRPGGSQSRSEEISRKSFQERAKKALGTESYRTISKRLHECRLLIGHKKSFVLLCAIGEQQLSSHFRVFLHAACCFAVLVKVLRAREVFISTF